MPYYCYHCDNFQRYAFFRGKPKICPVCGNDFYACYNTKTIAKRWAPIIENLFCIVNWTFTID
jgi:hypothetical protein